MSRFALRVTLSKWLWPPVLLIFLASAALAGCGQTPTSAEYPVVPPPSPSSSPSAPPASSTPVESSAPSAVSVSASTLAETADLTILAITEGDVSIMKSGTATWAAVEVGTTLENGDRIKAGDDAWALITFFEGSSIELEAGTEIGVIELIAADTGPTTIKLSQEVGKTVSRVNKLVDSASTYEVHQHHHLH